MSTKTITLSEDAYERLKALKEERESFSEVVRRVTKRRSLLEFAGILTKEEADQVKTTIREGRLASVRRAKALDKRFSQ